MATNFPGDKDNASTTGGNNLPSAGTELSDTLSGHPSHAVMHENVGDAIIATQTKVGTGTSTPAANTVLTGTGSGTSSWSTVSTGMISDGHVTEAKLGPGIPGVNAAGNQNTSGSAAKWTNARTLTVDGDMTGNVSIDGSQNVTLTLAADLEAADIPDIPASQVTGLNDSHTHNTQYYTESESDARFLGISAKAADSEKLDNLDSSQFLRSDTNDTFSGTTLTVSGGLTLGGRDLGEIVSFTPTWTNASGFQSNSGYYAYVKDLVYVSIEMEFSASVSVGSSIRVDLPVSASDTHQLANGMMQVQLFDYNAYTFYQGMTTPVDANTIEIRYNKPHPTDGIYGHPAGSQGPFTWADGDKIIISGIYRSGS